MNIVTYKDSLSEIRDLYEKYYTNENITIFRKEIFSGEYSHIFKKIFIDNNFTWNEGTEYLELCVWKSEYISEDCTLYNDQMIHQDLIRKGNKTIHLNTCIVYLENSFKVGGNLIFYDNTNSKNIIKVEKDLVCLFDGNIYHRPQNVKGNGLRACIIFQKEK